MDKVQSIQVEVTLDKIDVKRYIAHYYRRSIFLLLVSFLATVMMFALSVKVFLPEDSMVFLSGLDPLIIIFFILILLLPIVIYFLLLNTGKKYDLFKKRVFIINDKSINIQWDSKAINIEISGVLSVSETKNTFYIWQKNAPQILPKRFMTESDIEFVRILKK